MSKQFIYAEFLRFMSLLLVFICCMSLLHVHVHALCPWCMSTLQEHVTDMNTDMDMDMDWDRDTDLDPGMETDINTYMGIAMDMVLENIQ